MTAHVSKTLSLLSKTLSFSQNLSISQIRNYFKNLIHEKTSRNKGRRLIGKYSQRRLH